ncbi:MAG: prepilin-type N-terminal cleavage/methylation domain-containing protein [Candidatus Omnitrophica bacterium]|nr:prepilin-type N-terminal cleavage/methylation domain-containing protein [Candidatus Omnitrophota bacterium]
MKLNKKQGFTLLEIIVVIIIVGVLASLALPRLFSTIETTRGGEASRAIGVIRGAMERCYLQGNQAYTGCTISVLDIDDPGTMPGAHFGYAVSVTGAQTYTVTATRNSTEGGSTSDFIRFTQTTAGVTRTGSGAFSGVK